MSDSSEKDRRGSWREAASSEEARLRDLNDVHMLDSRSEDRFDRLTRLCTLIFEVPIAAITLSDRDHQWVKSKQGFEADSAIRGDNFYSATLRKSEILIVEHASQDPLYSSNPSVKGDPHIEFYAGYPLEVHGQRVGALCIMDRRTHKLTSDEETVLRELALWVQTELQRSDEHDRAMEIQHSLAPRALSPIEGYQVAGVYVPGQVGGGDFYTWSRNDAGQLIVTVADVMGRGVSAAVIMASVRAALITVGSRGPLDESLAEVSDALYEDLERTGAYATIFLTRITIETGEIEYVDAGFGMAVIIHEAGTFTRFAIRGLPLGIEANSRWNTGGASLEPGETLVIVSDGLWDMLGGDEVARDKIIERFRHYEVLNEAIASLLGEASEHEARDDVTIVAVRRDRLT